MAIFNFDDNNVRSVVKKHVNHAEDLKIISGSPKKRGLF